MFDSVFSPLFSSADVIDIPITKDDANRWTCTTRVMKKIHFGESLHTIVPQDFQQLEDYRNSCRNNSHMLNNFENALNMEHYCFHDGDLKELVGNSKKISKRKNQRRAKYRQTWTRDEDERLIRLIKEYGKKWSLLASKMEERRTGKQLRERYVNKLDPTINLSGWSQSEDDKLLSLTQIWGRKWCEISKFLPGRTDAMVKNRFKALLRITDLNH